MKCSKCQSEMIQAKNSWLCMSCGHLEAISPDSVPLVSKKRIPTKAVSQDMPSPSSKLKPEESKADKLTVSEEENKSEVKPGVAEVSASQAGPKPEESLSSPSIQDMNKTEEKSADIPQRKDEIEAKLAVANTTSVAPSAAELHPLQPVVDVSPTEPLSAKAEVDAPEAAAAEPSKPEPIPQVPAPVEETKSDKASTEPTPDLASSAISDVETVSPAATQPSEPESEPMKSESATVVETAPTEPATPKLVAPIPVAEPMPLPVPDAPAPVAPLPIPETVPVSATLKTVTPETHPASVNTGLIIWIIVALVSFIALVVFGYAFYKGIDLFAGFRK